ncbi:MAG: DNA recombination protein RmuC, partial [Bdellovibrionales bacterium]|nr:DNA recombination protein RmuC [Bdellovibrionales bacterium]
RSSEVWEILGAVKTEFEKFGGVLEKAQSKLREADKELGNLVGTRTNVIQRKLRDVESFSTQSSSTKLLEENSEIIS